MTVAAILEALKEERDRIEKAITVLETMGGKSKSPRRYGRRFMSAEARRRISVGMKKRWAERKGKN